jgi:ketosteroid isomerase-like protein
MSFRAPMFRRSALVTLALLPWLAQGQVRTKAITSTRQVKIFLDLETQLMEAQRSGDAAAVDKFITSDFEQRNAAQPGNPTPRAEWRASMREQWPGEIWLEQMAVHDRGDTALVSFLVRPGGKLPMMVVDAWIRAAEGWQLKVRYLSPSAA